MRKLNICFTSNSSPWTKFHGGGQIFIHNVAKNLSRMGHNVTVVYTGPKSKIDENSLKTDYKKEWAPYIGYPMTAKVRQLNSITVYNKLKNIQKKSKFEVINSLGGESLFIPKFCEANKIKFFVSIEHPNLQAVEPIINIKKPLYTFMNIIRARELWICRYACIHARGVITPSIFSKLEAIRYFKLNSSKIRVINHGIIDEMLAENSKTSGPNHKGPLLFFGRLEPQKGVGTLIKAYSRLIKEEAFLDKDLIIIGNGPYESEYRNKVYNLGLKNKVVFKGWRSPNYIKKKLLESSCCILPSTSESFGLAIAETLSQGVPLITTYTGSIPEVVDFGKGAWLAKPYDQNSLFFAIKNAIENYQESLRKAEYGKRYVKKKFSWENAAQEYEKLYFDMLKHT